MEPVSKTNGDTASYVIDTVDTNTGTRYDFLEVDVIMSTSDAATNEPTDIHFSSDDTETNVTAQTDIVALTGGTATSTSVGYVINAAADTSDANIYHYEIDARAGERYLGVSVTPPTTQVISISAHMYRGGQMPTTTTEANVENLERATL
jgi:hypothetical protein